MKMQLAFRETKEKLGGRKVYMVAGFVSTAKGVLPAEGIAEFAVVDGSSEGISQLGPVSGHYQPDRRQDPNYLSYSMGSFVTQRFWQIPRDADVMQLYCREIRMHTEDYSPLICQAYAVEGLVALAPDIAPDCDAISVYNGPAFKGFSLQGALGRNVNPDWDIPPMVEATRGGSLAQFFKMPLWGFGDEPVGLISSMHPMVCDAIDEFRNKPEANWRPGLQESLREWGLLWPKEVHFKETMDIIRSSYPGFLESRSSAGVETRAQSELMNTRMKQAIRQVLNQVESLSP